MTIDELFNKYPKNIIGFRVNQKNKIIDFWFPVDWTINMKFPDMEFIKHKTSTDGSLVYYTINSTNETTTFMEVFHALETVLLYNINLAKKKQLFDEKIRMLKTKFDELDIDQLKRLSFHIDDGIIETDVTNPIEDIQIVTEDEK